jgi:hypothetical protein
MFKGTLGERKKMLVLPRNVLEEQTPGKFPLLGFGG